MIILILQLLLTISHNIMLGLAEMHIFHVSMGDYGLVELSLSETLLRISAAMGLGTINHRPTCPDFNVECVQVL